MYFSHLKSWILESSSSMYLPGCGFQACLLHSVYTETPSTTKATVYCPVSKICVPSGPKGTLAHYKCSKVPNSRPFSCIADKCKLKCLLPCGNWGTRLLGTIHAMSDNLFISTSVPREWRDFHLEGRKDPRSLLFPD